MNKVLYRVFSWLRHSLTARNTHGHGVHSPKLFDIIQYVVDAHYPYYDYRLLEQYRAALLSDTSTLSVTDYGTGTSGSRSVCSIAASSLAPAAQAQLLYRLVVSAKAEHVLELGTSLGLTAAYLARAQKKAHVTSIEGAEQIADRARQTLADLKCGNAQVVTGNIDDALPGVLDTMPRIDILYIDANHTSAALMRYFEACLPKMTQDSIAIIDDIYWSQDMHRGWDMLTKHAGVTASFDMYHCGWLFFDKHLPQKQYTIRF